MALASSAIDMNTATLEELKSIPKIQDVRAEAILKRRKELGELTLDDLKQIPNIPSTIWDPLLKQGVITFGFAGQDTEAEEVSQEALVARYEATLARLENESKEREHQHHLQMEVLRSELTDRWRRQQTEHQEEMERLLTKLRKGEEAEEKKVGADEYEEMFEKLAPGGMYKKRTLSKDPPDEDAHRGKGGK